MLRLNEFELPVKLKISKWICEISNCYDQIDRMYNLGRSGSETGLFRNVFVWGWGRYGVGLYAALSLKIRVDPRNRVSGVKFQAVLAQNSAQNSLLCHLSNFTEGAIYKIACLDEQNLKLT